ncbi:MAG TPA: DUF6544 family protein [Polyangiaceae bacterium]
MKSSFAESVRQDVRRVLAERVLEPVPDITATEVERLPRPVQRWLFASGVVGRHAPHTVRLRQQGKMRATPHGIWMNVNAEQYFSLDRPGFVWIVDARYLGLPVHGRDMYAAGEGSLIIKLGSCVDLVNASDAKIASGALQRFLAESVWFPSAALRPYVHWTAIDDARARATVVDGDREVSVEFDFDGRGRVMQLRAERFFGGGANAKIEPWFVRCDRWRRVRGVEMPVHGEVGWHLEEGAFVYYRWEILDVEVDRPEPFSSEVPTASTTAV